MSFAVGSLVRARGREWVVLPQTTDELALLRPLGGTQDEATGILTHLEAIEPARFAWPSEADLGDARSAGMLRDALRLGFRSSAGPFRCFGRLAFEPRPYQLVPLLMSLRMQTVRLLIADDVGIGKTIEAGLVAAEVLEEGRARGLVVLCPPHLAEQWQAELATKFGIEAETVLASTAARLDRVCAPGQTIFERFPHTVVSIDFIKSDNRRDEFVRSCPDLVIVDEAHTCAADPLRGARHQRHQLVAGLAADPARHLVLVTATPHSGNEGAFASLVGLLDPALGQALGSPGDDSGSQARGPAARDRLANHLVQRRRADLATYLGQTPFPVREEAEATYRLHPDYAALVRWALTHARETVADASGGHHRQRVRWWAVLALLRALASSPAAAAATLSARADALGTSTVTEADSVGSRAVLDLGDDDGGEVIDVTPGADPTDTPDDTGPAGGANGSADAPDDQSRVRRRLRDMARAARALAADATPPAPKPVASPSPKSPAPDVPLDAKLALGLQVVTDLVKDRYSPLVFCRFIDTAEYVASALRQRLGPAVAVAAVTGRLTPTEREARVSEMAGAPKRVLVATDCLSEGVNLQESFDAVVHYDLAWNPTRHEQRDGRVDRYGQPSARVRSVTIYGTDNQIDEVVLKVLLRKQRAIRNRLGIFVAVPGRTEEVIEAIFERLLEERDDQLQLDLDEILRPAQARLDLAWEQAATREQASRSRFAQATIKVEEVAEDLVAVGQAIGTGTDVAGFVARAVRGWGGQVTGDGFEDGPPVRISLAGTPPAVQELAGAGIGTGLVGSGTGPARPGSRAELIGRYALPLEPGQAYLCRAHPFVEGLAALVLDAALDPLASSPARRAGVMRTRAVARRRTLLLLRLRYDLVQGAGARETTLLAEEAALVTFEGPPEDPTWLGEDAVAELLEATPDANVAPDQAASFVGKVISAQAVLAPALEAEAARRAAALLDLHRRTRAAARAQAGRTRVAHQPPDVLGIYVFLPEPGGMAAPAGAPHCSPGAMQGTPPPASSAGRGPNPAPGRAGA